MENISAGRYMTRDGHVATVEEKWYEAWRGSMLLKNGKTYSHMWWGTNGFYRRSRNGNKKPWDLVKRLDPFVEAARKAIEAKFVVTWSGVVEVTATSFQDAIDMVKDNDKLVAKETRWGSQQDGVSYTEPKQ